MYVRLVDTEDGMACGGILKRVRPSSTYIELGCQTPCVVRAGTSMAQILMRAAVRETTSIF